MSATSETTAYLAKDYGHLKPGTLVSASWSAGSKYVGPERFAWLQREGYLTNEAPGEQDSKEAKG